MAPAAFGKILFMGAHLSPDCGVLIWSKSSIASHIKEKQLFSGIFHYFLL
jgi:hypothetical protein